MLPLITKISLLLGLLLLLIANTADWVKLGISGSVGDKTSINSLAETDAGIWTHCASISSDVVPPKLKGGIMAGGIGGCGPLTQGRHGPTKDYMVACQVLSVICLVAVFLALVCSLTNRDLHLCTAMFSLVAVVCGLAVLIIYATKIKNQEIGSKDVISNILSSFPKISKDLNLKEIRGLSAGFYVQIVGVSLVSLAAIFSLVHHQKGGLA